MGEAVNPYASPTAADRPPSPDCESFYGSISRTFNLSRRYKFFITQGKLLAGKLPGGSFERVRRRVMIGMAAIVFVGVGGFTSAMVTRWEDELIYLFAGLAVAIIVASEGFVWISCRQKAGGLTLYDRAASVIEEFQKIDRHSFHILASEVVTMKVQRGHNVVCDSLDLILKPAAGRPQRLRIELDGMIDKLGIERALYEAGFPTMPTQQGDERE